MLGPSWGGHSGGSLENPRDISVSSASALEALPSEFHCSSERPLLTGSLVSTMLRYSLNPQETPGFLQHQMIEVEAAPGVLSWVTLHGHHGGKVLLCLVWGEEGRWHSSCFQGGAHGLLSPPWGKPVGDQWVELGWWSHQALQEREGGFQVNLLTDYRGSSSCERHGFYSHHQPWIETHYLLKFSSHWNPTRLLGLMSSRQR